MSAITAKAAKANIPVVVLDIGTGGAKINAFLRSDMYGGGAKAGRYFLDVMKQGLYPDITSKKVAIIKCETSATYAITRGEGFKSAVVPAGYTVVEEQHGNSNKNEAYKIMRVYINKYKNDLAAVQASFSSTASTATTTRRPPSRRRSSAAPSRRTPTASAPWARKSPTRL